MSQILVYAEASDGVVKGVTLEILGKLNGHNIQVVSFDQINDDSVKTIGEHGGSEVHILTGANQYSPEGYANALKSFIDGKNFDYVFAGSTSLGKDLFPRLSGMFDAGMATEVVEVKFEGDNFKGTRPLYAGKVLADVEITGPRPHFVTVRANALGMPESPAGGSANKSEAAAALGDVQATVKEVIKGASEKVDLTEANIIVSGGRSLKDAANFKILDEMAEVINATVGASRAAVDSGYAEPSMQVGQTGKTVSPSLYIACGISGAIQHLAGMRTSKVIVAINTDPDAPIFSKADYGIVGDLFKVVPVMKEEFTKLLGK